MVLVGDVLLSQYLSQISEGQAHPQQNQSSEIVTSSSGSANASSQQPPNETSLSSTGPATQSHGTRGAGSVAPQRGQRRGIQRQPIVWENPSSRPQAASTAQPIAGRGMHAAMPPRGGHRARRGRGMYGASRGFTRGGVSRGGASRGGAS